MPHEFGWLSGMTAPRRRDPANIHSFIVMLHDYKPDSPYHRFMPPMVGTAQDIDDLTNYLNAQVNPPAPDQKKSVLAAMK